MRSDSNGLGGCAAPLHALSDMAVFVKRKGGSDVPEVALHGFDIIPGSDRVHGVGMAQGVEMEIRHSSGGGFEPTARFCLVERPAALDHLQQGRDLGIVERARFLPLDFGQRAPCGGVVWDKPSSTAFSMAWWSTPWVRRTVAGENPFRPSKVCCPYGRPWCSSTGGGSFLLLFGVCCDMLGAGKNYLSALPVTVGGWPLHPGGDFLPPLRKEGVPMLTYSELFQFCLVVIGIVGLFIQVQNKKK